MDTNEKGCTCHGHDHADDHVHGAHCGCGHHHHEHVEVKPIEGMTALQQDVMLALHQRRYLPVARFVLTKAGDDEVQSVALAPVYLGSPEDEMDAVKALGAELAALEGADLITLDYDIPLKGYAYAEYKASALYAYFQRTVAEARDKAFLFDTAGLELGSMALTEAGERCVLAMLEQ